MNKNKNIADDDIPDLEDLSEEINKINKAKGVTSNSGPVKIQVKETKSIDNSNVKNENQRVPIKVVETKTNTNTNGKKEVNNVSQKDQGFGSGFKRGFFSKALGTNGNSNNTTETNISTNSTNNKTSNETNKNNEVTDLTNIKAKKNKYEIEEVQQNMKITSESNNSKFLMNDIMGKKDQWLNQELLMKLASNPKLIKAFTHPSFNEVIKLLQADPAEAKRKFGNDPEFNEFFKEFASLMASHFQNLGEKETNNFLKNQSSSDPEVELLLSDPKVKAVLEKMQKEGKLDAQTLGNDNDLIMKIDKLIKKGVFKTIPMK